MAIGNGYRTKKIKLFIELFSHLKISHDSFIPVGQKWLNIDNFIWFIPKFYYKNVWLLEVHLPSQFTRLAWN